MARDELSAGSINLIRSIMRRYPDLSATEARKLGGIVVDEVGKRIAAGEQLAFLRKGPEDRAELVILGLDVLRRRPREGER